MKRSLLRILRCPKCRAELDLTASVEDSEVREGKLACRGCRAEFPIVRSVPRFSQTNLYASNFSFEWNAHRLTWLDSHNGFEFNRRSLLSLLNISPSALRGKLFLDAGCGSGRFSEVVKDLGGEIVGIDLSYAVEACQANIGQSPNAHVVQGDLRALPFAEGVFDYVFTIGVLQHLPVPEEAFQQIAKSVAPAGRGMLAVSLYSDEGPTGTLSDFYMKARNKTTTIYRVFTTRISNESLYAILKRAIPRVNGIKSVNTGMHHIMDLAVPTSDVVDPELRLLDTFDWYSPRYQYYFSRHDVQKMYLRSGMVVDYLAATNNGIWARGHRPPA